VLTPYDHALVALITIGFPVRGLLVMRGRLRDVPDSGLSAARLTTYRAAMAALWVATLAVAALWAALRRPWSALGLVPVWGGGLIGILLGLVLVVAVVLRQSAAGLDARSATTLRRRMAHVERMMPHTGRELRWFALVAITAGICEEFLYRGFLIFYAQRLGLPLLPAAGIASVLFGVAHLYQGTRGVITTTLVGAFLSMIYLLSGSLFAGMLIHALMDLHTGHTLKSVYARDAEAGA